MHNLQEFEDKLKKLLGAHVERQRCEQKEVDAAMEEQLEQERAFNVAAANVYIGAIKPRLRVLEGIFDDVAFEGEPEHFRATLTFNTKENFSGSFKLEIEITPGVHFSSAKITYRLTVVPVFIHFKGSDEKNIPISDFKPVTVIEFVENAIQTAVVAYLEYRQNSNYHKKEFVRSDPVCGMPVYMHSSHFMAMHGDKEVHFCSEVCQQKFEEDPDAFLNGR